MNENHSVSPNAGHRLPARWTARLLAAAAAALACSTPGSFVPVEQYPIAAPDRDYLIAPGDILSVRVWNQDSMSAANVRVRDDGRISVPFLQDVEAAGVTPTGLSQQLQSKLKAYVVNPIVTVTVDQIRPLRVSVLGQVTKPGQYELERNAGVLAALAAAGGLTDYAHRDNLFVLRSGADSKGPTRIRFRYNTLTAGERPASTFRLRPGDVIVAE